VFEPEPAPAPAPEAAPVTTASTMRLTLSEIQAALASATPAPAGGGAGAYGSNPEPAGADPRFAAAATMPPGFILPPLTVPRNEAATHQVPVPPPSLAAQQDPNLLKIQLDQEIYNNVTLEQMSAWVDEGRVHEFDMVARQFSEHWIEANKVPALRPIFEQRRRRQGGEAAEVPIPPSEILPPKKGIFGGLFGRS